MDEFELEIKQDFLEESSDLLEAAESAFLRLEDERENPELINEIFRLAHNLKGTSKAVGFDQLAELTHVAENLILKIKNKTFEVNDEIVTALLVFKDKVFEMIEGLKLDFNATFEIETLKVQLEDLVEGKFSEVSTESSSTEVLDSQFEDIPDATLFEAEGDIQVISEDNGPEISDQALQSLRDSGFDDETIRLMLAEDSSDTIPINIEVEPVKADIPKVEQVTPIVETKKQVAVKASVDPEESIRVKLSRIDKMTNLIGELVILQTVVSQRRFEFIKDDLANKSIGHMGKLFKEIQELSMSLRMLPLKGTFQKMNRIVRDTSKALDKDVKLQIRGEETEVDKTVLERLSDPLVHIVRNAVDHGLESRDNRILAEKPEQGVVELLAFHEGSNLVIQVTDDGAGIRPEVIEKKAIEKGVIDRNHMLDDQQLINLIFHPGLSTKTEVTEVSGRGVGMDVVKTNIEGLGGEVKLMSKVGQGSSLKIVLPLTLAIIEGIIIGAGDEKFVIPLNQIYEISHVQNLDIESFSGVGNLFKLRGEVLPLFFINKKIDKKVSISESYTVIVVRGLNYAFGVVVDDIKNQQQIVIKKLGEDVQGRKGIMGSAIMSDGMPSLILDVFELFKDDLKQNTAHQKFKQRKQRAA